MVDALLIIIRIKTCHETDWHRPLVPLRGGAKWREEYHCTELDEFGCELLAVEADIGTTIAAEITVVGGTEDGYAFAIMGHLVAFVLYFMRTDQQTLIK